MTLPIFLRTDNDNSSTASVALSLVLARIKASSASNVFFGSL
jgi:hypothetical protein